MIGYDILPEERGSWQVIPEMIEDDLDDIETVRWIKNYTAGLGIPFRQWHEFLADFYRDLPAMFVDVRADEVFIDMDTFETEGIDYWFRDFCVAVGPNARIHVRREARARVCALGNLMRAHARITRH